MPRTVQDENGVETTVYTEEELKALEEEKTKAVSEAEEKLAALNEELSKLKEKDLNFSNLRSQKEDAEKRIDALKEEMEKRIETTKKEMQESNLKEHYTSMLDALTGGDEELKKKVEHHYSRLSDPSTDKATVEKKLKDAWALSQDRPVDRVGNAFASMGSAPIKPSASNKSWSEDEKELAQKLASAGGIKLSDDDFKNK